MKRYLFIFLLIFTIAPGALAQITFQFIPEINGRNLDGLFSCRIVAPGAMIRGTLSITVRERQGGTICVIRTPEFVIAPGANPIPVSAARGAAIRFSNNRIGQLTGKTRFFPQGDYEYCYSLNISGSDNPPVEQCFDYTLEPFAELNLIDPYDKDKICDKRPLLTWQPLIPAVPGALYQLVLSEIKSGQSPTEALNYNLPLVNQSSILSPVLPYPAVARELESQKRYAWQVTAYKDQTVLNRSQVWEFMVDCRDSVKNKPDSSSYRSIEDLQRGNFYIAARQLKFALVNPYQAQNLQYEIYPVTGSGKKIKHLPKIKLLNGANSIAIALDDTGAFTDNRYYVIYITLPNGDKKSLRFLYQDN
jgi:hypothetical protein